MNFQLLTIVCCFISCTNILYGVEEKDLLLRAEFDVQEAIWVSWSSDQAKIGCPYSHPQTDIIQALVRYIPVKVFVSNLDELVKAKAMLETNNTHIDRLSYYVMSSENIWLRDICTALLSNQYDMKAIPDFAFNGYGSEPFLNTSQLAGNKSDAEFRKFLGRLLQLPVFSSDLVSEGGNRETNGRGTLLVTDAVDRQRNPKMTDIERIEKYKNTLNVRKVICLNKGLVQDDQLFMGPVYGPDGGKTAYTTLGNGGHVDAFCRFVGPHTIVLAEVDKEEAKTDPIAAENRRRLEENYVILKNSTDQDEHPFEILRMPAASTFYVKMGPGDPIFDFLVSLNFNGIPTLPINQHPLEKEALFLISMSYLNFLISNEVVLVAKYWKDGYPDIIKRKDEQALRILRDIFPDKDIIQIDVFNLNLCGGGIHCLTQYESI